MGNKPNYRLLRRIRDVVLREYKRVDMDESVIYKSCGTSGCIAGWACILTANNRGQWKNDGFENTADLVYTYWLDRCAQIGDQLNWDSVKKEAERALGVESGALNPLFYLTVMHYNPQCNELATKLAGCRARLLQLRPGTKTYAKIVAKAIDITIEHLKEKERELSKQSRPFAAEPVPALQ